MIIVADSGSSTTNWVVIDNKKPAIKFNTNGINPYFTSGNQIAEELKVNTPETFSRKEITKLYFYGSGCSSDEMNKIVLEGLSTIYANAIIEVNSDLLAAARSLFFNDKGIAVILGTGASTGLFDGFKITKRVLPLGYILGNEGGGDYLGKLLITDFLNDDLPKEIQYNFINQFNFSKSNILKAIYKEPYPNRFLASFSNFISDNKKHKYTNRLVKKSFTDLFTRNICKYDKFEESKIRFSGSVAFHFQSELKEVASEFNVHIDLIEQKPIHRLVKYHIRNIISSQ